MGHPIYIYIHLIGTYKLLELKNELKRDVIESQNINLKKKTFFTLVMLQLLKYLYKSQRPILYYIPIYIFS